MLEILLFIAAFALADSEAVILERPLLVLVLAINDLSFKKFFQLSRMESLYLIKFVKCRIWQKFCIPRISGSIL
jgi:hypothetical protein